MKVVEVVAGIIEKNGHVLLAERPVGKRLAGFWEFPGGKIEDGESTNTALHRELKEELQLDVRIKRNLGSFPHVYEWGEILLHVLVVEPLGEPQTTVDVPSFIWCDPQKIDVSKLTPADRPALAKYLLDLSESDFSPI